MSKNPSGPSGSRDRVPGGDVPSPVSFFYEKGEKIGRQAYSNASPPKSTEELDYIHNNTSEIDNNPILVERIANQAADVAREHADDLGEMLYSKFMHLLFEVIKDTSGQLTAADVERMGQEFKAELTKIETIFIEAVDAAVLSRERSRTEQVRSKVFYRLMVHKFEHRFADERDLEEHPERLSRRMLPGFYSVLLLMFGEQRIARYEREAKKIIDGLERENGGRVDWSEIYQTAKMRRLCFRAEVEFAQYFTETEKRLKWMAAVINANLLPPDKHLPARPWVLNSSSAEKLLSMFFRDIRIALGKDKARNIMVDRFGAPTVALLEKIVGRFSKAQT